MPLAWSQALGVQFGAAIRMLENAVRACPDELWGRRRPVPEFWYLAYHTAFWLDCYLSPAPDGFAPPPPFTLSELDSTGARPDRVYTQAEVLGYLEHGREKCQRVLAALTDEEAARPSGFEWFGGTVAELHLYNLRHVQHGAAQLGLLLRQAGTAVPGWVNRVPAPDATP